MDCEHLKQNIPELNWRFLDKEKRGADHFYFFKYSKNIKGIVYCYPNHVTRSKEDIEKSPFLDREKHNIKKGKRIVELMLKQNGDVKKYKYKTTYDQNVMEATRSAFASWNLTLLKTVCDDKKDDLRNLIKRLRQRDLS